jgi:hypothetical protein
VSPVQYELDFYIPEDGILHSHRHENLILHILQQFANILQVHVWSIASADAMNDLPEQPMKYRGYRTNCNMSLHLESCNIYRNIS